MKPTDNIEDLTPLTDRERELTATIEKQNACIEKLTRELHEREAYCTLLEDRQDAPGIKPQMLDALLDAVHDDCKPDELLHMLWGFDYLLMERRNAQ